MTRYAKEDDYTICLTSTPPGTKGQLTRYFNFASEQITTIYAERADMRETIKSGAYDGGAGVSVSVALTSQMSVQKFSELDSQAEVEMMRAALITLGGKPPEASSTLPGKNHPRLGS